MNGTILSFDAAGGLLRGDDGKRYAFDAAEWRSETAPAAGTRADFEPDGDRALALYAVSEAPAPAEPGAWFADRPGIPIAILILLACVLPFITLGPFTANLFNLVGVASRLGEYAPVNVNMETGLWLFHGLYVVPVVALALIALEWRGLAGRWWRIGIGLVLLVAPVAIALGARALFATTTPHASLGRRILRRLREDLAPDLFAPHIGMGWIAIAALSVALILVGIFWPSRSRES